MNTEFCDADEFGSKIQVPEEFGLRRDEGDYARRKVQSLRFKVKSSLKFEYLGKINIYLRCLKKMFKCQLYFFWLRELSK